jgi:hypothetical protein
MFALIELMIGMILLPFKLFGLMIKLILLPIEIILAILGIGKK